MKSRLNLLLLSFLSWGLSAQNQTNMENKNNANTEGNVIKHGKLIYSEITIKASPEKVWQIFTNFEKYPEWNPFIKLVKGMPTKGEKIETFLQLPEKKGMAFKPTVLVYNSLKEFSWSPLFSKAPRTSPNPWFQLMVLVLIGALVSA